MSNNTSDSNDRRLGRRALIQLAGGLGATLALGACGGTASTPAGTTAPPASAPPAGAAPTIAAAATRTTATAGTATRAASGTAASGTAGAGATVRLAPPAASFPTGKISFRWVDAGLDNRSFFPTFFDAYQKSRTNVTVQYDNVTDDNLRQLVTTGVQNGNAHDAFRGPGEITSGQMVREGWVAPLDEIVPNFAQWQAAFPPNSFFEGVNVFNGKTYSFPHLSAKQYGNLMFYNTDYMARADYDPAKKPLTWDEFRAAAKKITEQGKGQYYGYLLAGGVAARWSIFVSNVARMAGPVAGASDMNWKTGEFAYTSDPYIAAIELLLAMKADGSFFPGSISINQQNAVAQMPQGVAGMFLSVTSNIPIYIRDTPFPFEVASQPIPNGGNVTPLSVPPSGTFWFCFSKSKNQQVVGDIFSFLGTTAGQSTFQEITGGGSRLTFPEANTVPSLSEQARRAYALYDEQCRLGPEPSVRNGDTALVQLERRALTPNFGQVVQGLFTGQVRDAKAAMQDLQDRSEAELERALKAAQGKGAKVSRDDWKFANWDPTRDYTEADYKAL